MDGHKEAVRVLLTVKTLATVSSTRVSKFISDEQVRNLRQSSIIRSQDEDLAESFEDSFLDSCSHEGDDEEGGGLEEPPFPSPLQYLRSPEMPQVTLQNGTVIDTRSPSPLASPMVTFSTSGGFSNGGMMLGLQEETQPVEDELQGSESTATLTTAEIHPPPEAPSPPSEDVVTGGPDSVATIQATADSRAELLDLSSATQIVSANEEDGEPPKENGGMPAVASDYEVSPALKTAGKDTAAVISEVLQHRLVTGSSVGPPGTVVSPEGEKEGHEESIVLADTQVKLEVEGENEPEIQRRVASPDSIATSGDYDTVGSYSTEASPYEDPTTLEHGGPVSAPVLFSPVASTSTVPTIPGRSTEPQEGAVFLLTAGRGLMNFRPGYKTGVLFPTPSSSAVLSSDSEEAAMIAYEVEH